jgi:hypothetical protein
MKAVQLGGIVITKWNAFPEGHSICVRWGEHRQRWEYVSEGVWQELVDKQLREVGWRE